MKGLKFNHVTSQADVSCGAFLDGYTDECF